MLRNVGPTCDTGKPLEAYSIVFFYPNYTCICYHANNSDRVFSIFYIRINARQSNLDTSCIFIRVLYFSTDEQLLHNKIMRLGHDAHWPYITWRHAGTEPSPNHRQLGVPILLGIAERGIWINHSNIIFTLVL